MERFEQVEHSIIKKFRRQIWSRFTKALKEFRLVNEGDRIAVCISGGKDSMLLAKCMQELQRHGKTDFSLVYLVMDPGYHEANRQLILENARQLHIPITMFESQIFDIVKDIDTSPCYLCARMRRGHLYHEAQSLGCNKIALGHHFDDVIETILMSMLYGGEIKTMMPKLHSTNFAGMQLIRPLYYVREADIARWRDENGLTFLRCACRFTENLASDLLESKREEVKQLIRRLQAKSPFIEKNIYKSVYNVNADAVIAYKKHGRRYHFMDAYED